MTEPTPESTREKIPHRLGASLRRMHWKDATIGVLALLFLSMSAFAFREPLAHTWAKMRAGAQGGETVAVFDVVVDRENRQYFDILFDKPLGQGKVGEVLDPAPASIFPNLGGTWKWQDTNALRFQPSGGLPVASEYQVELDPEPGRPAGTGLHRRHRRSRCARTSSSSRRSRSSRSRPSRARPRSITGARSGSTTRSTPKRSRPWSR